MEHLAAQGRQVGELDACPRLDDGEALFFEVFGRMHRDRPASFGGLMPLPSAVIERWADRLGFTGMDRDDFTHAVEALDRAWLDSSSKPTGQAAPRKSP